MSESFAAGLIGIVLDDRYRLDALLGEGGMGAVYRAHHLAMDRKVAVKLLKPHLSTDEIALQRFAREARSTMKVESEHAVKVLDFGITPHKDYYMVLEYLDGRSVQRELDVDGPFAPARVIHIARQSLLALGAAHDKGLVHRDIKPDNIFLSRIGDDGDFTKLLDFGVAKLMEGAEASSRSALAITQAGMVFGTPEFMSPEQACGQTLDGRSDLYSLAATMFAMLTGCGMYKASAPIEWLSHHARTPPPHLADGLPSLARYAALDRFLQHCLAKRREDRPANAAEMIRMLDAVEPSVRPGATSAVDRLSTASGGAARPGKAGACDPSATLLPDAQDAATPELIRLPRQSDAISAFTPSVPSELVEALPLPSTTSGLVAQVRGGRRAVWLLLGAAAVTAMIVVAIVIATRKRSPRDAAAVARASGSRTAATDAPAAEPPDAPVAAVVLDAGVAARPIDGGARGPNEKRPTPTNPVVAAHLAAAEDAKRAGNRLRQLAEADAALQAEPRNVRARLLFADALIASGDLDRGCKHLRDLGRNPTARERARQAGCPTN